MNFSGLQTLVQRSAVTCVSRMRASLSAVSSGCLSLPWTHCRCCYSTKQKKLSHFIRWNQENKLLFGTKKTAAKKKLLVTGTANVTKQPITTANKSASKTASKTTKTAKSKKTNASAVKTEQRLEKMTLAAISHDYDSGEVAPEDEWWHEGNAVTKTKNGDLFHKHNELYNSVLDSGQGFDSSASDYSSNSSKQLDIPPLPPISGSKPSIEYPPKPTTKSGKSSTKKSASKSTDPSTAGTVSSQVLNIPGIDFVRQCPLLPDKFAELQSSAQEFQSFVDTLGMRFLPTVNVVLNKTRPDISNFFLQRWREKMIGELGEIGFKKHQEATIWQGTTFHACVQQYLSGIPVSEIQVQDSIQGHWDSLASVLPDVSHVQALETSVSHPWLCYKGTFDCIAKYKNVLYVIDWKTSSKPKPLLSNLYDNPLQVAAYLGAINLNADFTEKFGVLDQCAVVVAYSNGQAAHIHRITPALCQHYWQEWCLRLHQFWTTIAEEKMTKK